MLAMIWTFFSNLFGFGEAVSKEVTQRDAEENTPDMKENAQAASKSFIATAATKDVAGGDSTLDQLRKDASEN